MNRRLSFILIATLFLVIASLKISDKNFGKNGNYGVIDWDNFGYYLYLPAAFIYDDLEIQNDKWVKEVQVKYDLSTNFYQAHNLTNGNRVIQYTSGMALLYSPAFFIGHLVANLSSYPADGFSKPYQLAILLQSFLILFLGLFYLRKLSRLFFNETIAFFIIFIICLGTNYFQLAVANISSPHIYLFAAYSFLLHQIIKWHFKPSLKTLLSISVVAALMILSRPNELLFLIIPLFLRVGIFTTVKSKLSYLVEHKKQLFALFLPFILIGILQPLYWYFVTGEIVYDSYKNEDFKLLNPYLTEYLFSYKKGWLLYTPMMVFGLLGFIFTLKRKPGLGIPLFVFVVLNIWVLSSWDCWWYADSFSQRSIVQSYPVFLFSFGYLLEELKGELKSFRITIVLLLILITGYNLFQTWQFQSGIIHPNSMTKEYYWNILGETNSNHPNRSLLAIDRNINYLPENDVNKHQLVFYESFGNSEDFIKIDSLYYKKEGSLTLTQENPKSKRIRLAYKDISDTSYCYTICRIRFKSNYEASVNPFGIEFNMIDSYNGKAYNYKYRGAENISWFEKGSWSSMDIVVIPPLLRNADDSIQFNLRLFGKNEVEIDNMSIEVLDPSIYPLQKEFIYYNDYFTISPEQWSDPKKQSGEKRYEQLDASNPYSSTFRTKMKDLKVKNNLRFGMKVNLQNNYSDTYAVVSIEHNNQNLFYQSHQLIKVADNWENLNYDFELPKEINPDAELRVYLWNKSNKPTLVRSLTASFQ